MSIFRYLIAARPPRGRRAGGARGAPRRRPGSIIVARRVGVRPAVLRRLGHEPRRTNSVTIAPGETVTFNYPVGPRVAQRRRSSTPGPQPTSCTQTVRHGDPGLPDPAAAGVLVAGTVGGQLHVQHPGHVQVLLHRPQLHDGRRHRSRGAGQRAADGHRRRATPSGDVHDRHAGRVHRDRAPTPTATRSPTRGTSATAAGRDQQNRVAQLRHAGHQDGEGDRVRRQGRHGRGDADDRRHPGQPQPDGDRARAPRRATWPPARPSRSPPPAPTPTATRSPTRGTSATARRARRRRTRRTPTPPPGRTPRR